MAAGVPRVNLSAGQKSGGAGSPDFSSETWFTLSVTETYQRLQTDGAQGLSNAAAAERLTQYGPNTLSQARQRSVWVILLAQFQSLIVALLLAAALIAMVMGEGVEAVAIFVVIGLNAAIGFFTEWKAEQALSALQKQTVRVAQVVRQGAEHEIPAADLVPGDLVVLAAGARVPADGRIVESVRLQIEEAALTGESLPVTKTTEPLQDKDAALGDRLNMAFLGTTITDGRGRLVVTATAAATEVGKIGVLIDEATSRSTPLEQKLTRLGRLLILIVIALCAIIVVAGWLRGVTDFWHMLEIGLSLAIAAVPEGLPAVTTMTLALGMQRMARQRALVRRLPAVETLGSTTIICTDKTGTLTKNEMTVCVGVLGQRRIEITGAGYEPTGSFQEGDVSVNPQTDAHLALSLQIGMLCNDAKVERTNGRDIALGDPTEAALIVAAEKAGFSQADLARDFPRVNEIPFDSTTKRMVTVHRSPHGKLVALIKGSPATVLAASSLQLRSDGSGDGTRRDEAFGFCNQGTETLTDDHRRQWEVRNRELAGAALRVLGLAFRELPENHTDEDFSRELVYVGLMGMSDPLRDEARAAIETCREAGIRTVMITGDQQLTAAEIARQLGLDTDVDGHALRTVHSRELVGLDEAGWQRVVSEAAVFARVSPEHKLQIVEAFQQQGHIVAMTGDGVNDAPALKKADIGIAMGIKGTEVAKENADMVITDDNFASIVGAVEEGRVIYGNIIRFLHYLLSCNSSEILVVFLALMIGWPLPLVALQILWLNLITDVFPAFALALEPAGRDVMKRPPRDPQEALLTSGFVGLIVWQGLMLTSVTLIAFGVGLSWYGDEGAGLLRANTMSFMTLAFAQVFHVFSARSQTRSVFDGRLLTNVWLWVAVAACLLLQLAAVNIPLLQRVLHTVRPGLQDWGVIVICSLMPVAMVELVKVVQRTVARRQATA